MKKKLLTAFYIVALVVGAFLLYYDYGINGDTHYFKILAAVVAMVSFLAGKKKEPVYTNYKKFEEAYKDVLEGAFVEDKASYKKLLRACVCHSRDIHQEAYEILDELEKKCTRTKDRIAVYTLRGICFADQGRKEEAIAVYEKVLQYDMTFATVWSNLGLCYAETGRTKEAYEAYKNSINYDPNNEYAYTNMAVFLINLAEPEEGLAYGLKALEINPNMKEAISWVAVAYKMLGDEENAKRYCLLYDEKGGNQKQLEAYLEKM